MGRALLPQHDAGEKELWARAPPWRAGGPATLRVLILALLWRVPQSVSVQEGLCVLVPCNFTYPASSDTDNPSAQLYGKWYKEPATGSQDRPVASSLSNGGVSQKTQGRFRLTGDPALGDCSLQINDARRTDAGRYFLSIEKGSFEHTYRSNADVTVPALTISEPEIQISPVRGLPGTLVAGKPVTVTCMAPGRCSWTPPQVTWTGPFSDTARNVSAPLAKGTWAHSSALSFTPGPGDHGKELVCNVTYSSAQGPSTSRTVQLLVGCDIAGTLTRNGRPGERLRCEPRKLEGDSLSLSCEAGSRADAILSWAKGHESLSPGHGGAGHLELLNLSRGDAGEYRCWAMNSYGWASQALHVHMQCKALGGAVPQGAGWGLSGACCSAGGRAVHPEVTLCCRERAGVYGGMSQGKFQLLCKHEWGSPVGLPATGLVCRSGRSSATKVSTRNWNFTGLRKRRMRPQLGGLPPQLSPMGPSSLISGPLPNPLNQTHGPAKHMETACNIYMTM
uniref:Ig-like domain-containing protein n=1 Tax=Chrysemys picta bellii TaxID=8478 RepID=A0A8C3F2X4_CHRPI